MSIMRFTSSIAAAILLFSAGIVVLKPLGSKAGTVDTFSLIVSGPDAKANIAALGSYDVSFDGGAAWIGKIKQESSAEPLLLYGNDRLAFKQSFLKNPNSYQNLYVVPHVTAPLGFSVPHSFPPPGVQATGFGFSKEGALEMDGENKFIACPSTNAANPHPGSYQIWWNGNGVPQGAGCLTDIQLVKAS
ncbi:MAG: hypothetical protein LQ347_002677 [Umbilicaria vellea]|nr:MAG: hypothetical protein LQ347_002677 [Umbilicaria vellea]